MAAFVRRRNLGTVEVPPALTGAVEAAAAASSTRSSKLQRKETLQLTAALKQLSRTPGKGGTAMSLIDANAGSSAKKRRKRVTLVAALDVLVVLPKHPSSSHCDFACLQTPPVKQTLRDLRHALPVSMTSPEEDDTDDSDAESSWDTSDATEDRLRSAFGNHDLPGVLSVPFTIIYCLPGAAIISLCDPCVNVLLTGQASHQLLTCCIYSSCIICLMQ